MEKLIITFVAGGVILNLVYIVAVLSQGLFAENPWYIFLAGILLIVAAITFRNRRS